MKDRLEEIGFYKLSMELWDEMWIDAEKLLTDFRGKEIARQLVRSVGSGNYKIQNFEIGQYNAMVSKTIQTLETKSKN